MKKLFLITACVLTCSFCKAQIYLIDQPKQAFVNWLDTTKSYTITKLEVPVENKVLKNFYELRGNINNDQVIRFYFDKNDTCRVYRVLVSAKYSTLYITQLNTAYNKVDDNKWIDKSNTYQILTYILNGVFIIDYTKI